jgi:hypothetical protein
MITRRRRLRWFVLRRGGSWETTFEEGLVDVRRAVDQGELLGPVEPLDRVFSLHGGYAVDRRFQVEANPGAALAGVPCPSLPLPVVLCQAASGIGGHPNVEVTCRLAVNEVDEPG